MTEQVDWLAPLVVLGVGFLIAIVFLTRGRRGADAITPVVSERDDLHAHFDLLVAKLRELGEPADGESLSVRDERARLERNAALILREIDVLPATVAVPAIEEPVSEDPLDRSTAALRRFAWVTAGCSVFAVLYILLMNFTGQRQSPQDPMTGMPVGDERPAAVDPQIAQLEQRVASAPEDIEARVELARNYLQQNDLMKVAEQTKYVLQRQPEHPRALTYEALVRLAMGNAALAKTMLETALRKDPDLVEAWLHMALVHVELGDKPAAMNALGEAKKRAPERAAMLGMLEQEIENRFSPKPESPKQAAVPAEVSPAPAAEQASGSGVTVNAELPGGDVAGRVVFATLRPAGVASGPPLLVKKLTPSGSRFSFTFTEADAMQGGTLPAASRIEVRVDGDGDPMTKPQSDPAAVADNVALGQAVTIVLR